MSVSACNARRVQMLSSVSKKKSIHCSKLHGVVYILFQSTCFVICVVLQYWFFSYLTFCFSFICSDWIDWQPDEKRKIRILDLLESVRKTALKRSASSAATLRSQRSSSSSLPANEETGRALRLHHSRQHSHSLRNLSPNHHGSHPKVSKSHQISPPDHHYTFTR